MNMKHGARMEHDKVLLVLVWLKYGDDVGLGVGRGLME
jgi:hypothetical protein